MYDTNTSHYLGWSDAQSQSGYYSEFYLIDGQQLAPTEFGKFDSDTNIWTPKEYTGTFGKLGVISFNGNKIITAGGGGCIITNDRTLAKKAKHLSTTAKLSHKWDFKHDMIGYNYRMPNLNAALLLAQLENLNKFLASKRKLANQYKKFFKSLDYNFFKEPKNSKSNYWLNCIILKSKIQRDLFLKETNSKGIMTRPIWTLMNKLPMFKQSQSGNLKNAYWLSQRIVNLPSSTIL